ncbi:PREDICTED: probable aspartyl aminopeptidase-like [Fragaria vesca subsp. vesca]
MASRLAVQVTYDSIHDPKRRTAKMKFKRENSLAKSQIHIDEQKNAINTIEIDISPDEAKKRLQSAGYEQVLEREDWNLESGKKYFFTRNYSTIVAFAIVEKAKLCVELCFRFVAGNGFHVIGAHTDSPCLILKPVSKVTKGGFLEVEVQKYGGGLWHTWFDRDLTIAGREEKDGSVSYSHRLVRIEEPIMWIPTLAIHLDRDVTEAFKVNAQSPSSCLIM